MAQVFPRAANSVARVSLALALIVPAAVLFGGSTITRSSYNTKAGTVMQQPVPFSHMHHVAELGIDCRYCHTSVERSATAGVPPTHTCMGCHSQIWTNSPLLEPVRKSYETGKPLEWAKVASVPDFVYFNHSIHVAKGVGCDTCHGPINQMHITYKAKAFQMTWCLDCHRQPEKFLRPKSQVFNMDYQPPADQPALGRRLVKEYGVNKKQLADCVICHR